MQMYQHHIKLLKQLLLKKNVIISTINALNVFVLLSNTNSLFVIYANSTAQNHEMPLLTTSSIPIALAAT